MKPSEQLPPSADSVEPQVGCLGCGFDFAPRYQHNQAFPLLRRRFLSGADDPGPSYSELTVGPVFEGLSRVASFHLDSMA